MIQVFSQESGGFIIAPIDETIPATSGYSFFYGKQHHHYRLDGILASGHLYISKSGIGQFIPGEYLMLPQVVDVNDKIYFLTPQDIDVIFIPEFIQNTYFISGDSLISGFIAHIQDHNNPHQTTAQQVGAEPYLGNPSVDAYVLSSTIAGARSWIPQTGGSGGVDAYYKHVQSLPASTWTITHNLSKHPSVEVVDSGGANVYGYVTYISDNQLTVSFSAAFSGEAYCN